MPAARSLTPAEAAAQAAASYVWTASHRQGVAAGWAAGWAAAQAAAEKPCPERSPSSSSEEQDEHEHEHDESFELDEAWAALFAKGARRRAAQKELSAGAAGVVELDLGGRREQARKEMAKELYGEQAGTLLEREAELMVAFEEKAAQGGVLWPVISIKEGQAPRASI